ncbi:hypothetical protein ACFCZJ_36700, partial [Streptomyces rubiginosohelvolus]
MSTTSFTDGVPAAEAVSAPVQPRAGETAGHRALALLAQHRLVTTPQMHQMLSPGKSHQRTSQVLTRLRQDELSTFA